MAETPDYINFQRQRSVAEVLNATFIFIRQNYKKFGQALLYIPGPYVLVAGLLGGLTIFSEMTGGAYAILGVFGYAGIALIYVFAWISMITTVYGYISLYIERGPDGFELDELKAFNRKNGWRIFGAMLCTYALMIFGYVLVILPGIYLTVVFSIIYAVVTFEKIGVFKAPGRCIVLVRDNISITFRLIILAFLMLTPLNYVLKAPHYILIAIVVGHEGNSSSVLMAALGLLAAMLDALGFFLWSVKLVAMAFHYFSLLECREAAGLRRRLSRLNNESSEISA